MWSRIVSFVDDINYVDDDEYGSDHSAEGDEFAMSRSEEIEVMREELAKWEYNYIVTV